MHKLVLVAILPLVVELHVEVARSKLSPCSEHGSSGIMSQFCESHLLHDLQAFL